MARLHSLIVSLGLATLTLSGCNQAPAPTPGESATTAADPAASGGAPTVAAAAAGEPGSGTYAADCTKPAEGHAITLTKGADGMTGATVSHGGKSYANLLTSYSYMGENTPADFHVAVLFDEGNAPVPANAEGSRLEIWKGEAAFYVLVNGDKAQRLSLCS